MTTVWVLRREIARNKLNLPWHDSSLQRDKCRNHEPLPTPTKGPREGGKHVKYKSRPFAWTVTNHIDLYPPCNLYVDSKTLLVAKQRCGLPIQHLHLCSLSPLQQRSTSSTFSHHRVANSTQPRYTKSTDPSQMQEAWLVTVWAARHSTESLQ